MRKVIFSLFFILINAQIFAHSLHYEIQVSNKLIVDNQHKLKALDLIFKYDETVSLVMLQDQKNLKKLAKNIMTELDTLGYFTQIKLNGKVLQTTKVNSYNLTKGKRSVLSLHFTLPIVSPQKLTGKSRILLDHADPSASAILYYDNKSAITWGKSIQKNCKSHLAEKKEFGEGEFPQIVLIECNMR